MPHQVSGSTVKDSPSTSRDPDQRPFWQKRAVSKSRRPNLRMSCLGSSKAAWAPSKVMSRARGCSVGSSTKRILRSGSTTSTRSGPVVRSMRSSRTRLERTTRCLSPRRTTAKASWVPRLG